MALSNKIQSLILLCILAVCTLGCSSSTGPILPSGELTAEQLEKIKAEDRAVEDEESQGSIKK